MIKKIKLSAMIIAIVFTCNQVAIADDTNSILAILNERVKSVGWGSWKPIEIPDGVLGTDASCHESPSGEYKKALYISDIKSKQISSRLTAYLVYTYFCGGNGVGVDLIIKDNNSFRIVDNFGMADMDFVGDFDRVENEKIYFTGNKWNEDDPHCCPSLKAELEYDIRSGKQNLKIIGSNATQNDNVNNKMPTPAASQLRLTEQPFKCVFDPALIACDVRIDEVNITNVSLNRGNCESPIPSEYDLKLYNEKRREMASSKNVDVSQVDALLKPAAIIGYSMRFLATGPDRENAAPLARAALNPIGTFRFGETFQILNTCQNIIEVTIIFNGLSASTQDGSLWR